jgi:hypothetical protein
VFTLNIRPTGLSNPFDLTNDPTDVQNQQEVNWWFYEHLGARFPIFSDTPPVRHPGYDDPDTELELGDIWINTIDPDQFTQLTWDGNEWVSIDDPDRPPIVSINAPTEHPKFPGKPLKEGDLWLDDTDSARMSLYAWDEPMGTWVPVGDAGRPPIFSNTEPTEHPDFSPPNNQLEAGDLWYDTTDPDEIIQYIYDGQDWLKTGGDYVRRKGGDSMEGPLNVTGQRSPNADGVESTVKALNIDSGQNSSLQFKHNGSTRAYLGNAEFTLVPDLKFNSNGKSIYSGNDKKGFTINTSGVFYEGVYTADKHIATKKNVEDAIASIGSDKEGLFAWDADSAVLPIGTWQFEGRTNPSYTVDGVQVVNIQKVDKNGLAFTDTDFAVGGQIEIKNVNNDDYILGTVTNIVDGGPKSVQITFNRNRAQGRATGDQTIKTVTAPQPYVNTAGDAMTGDLKMRDNAQIQFIDPTGSPTLIRAGRQDGEFPMIFDLRHPGGQVAGGYDIKVQGNSSYNALRITNAKGTAFEVNGGGGAAVGSTFKMDVSLDDNRITKLGDATDNKDAVPYGQVKRELTEKFNEYVDTISFGTYTYTVSNNPSQGYFAAYTTNGGQTEHTPASIRQLWISKLNKAGDDIGLTSLAPGDLIRFADGADLFQFRVNGTPDDQGTWLKIDVNKGVGPSDLTVNNDLDITLIKLTGGSVNLDDYLKIDASNDPLTGNLEINQGLDNTEAALKLTGSRPSTVNSAATITFENTNSTSIGYLTYRAFGSEHYFRFNQDVDLNNNGLHSVSRVRMEPGGTIESGNNARLKVKNASNADAGEGLLEVPRPANNRRGFTIRGSDSDGNETDILYTYTNPSGPDAINYAGKMDGDTNIVNLAKVKELINGGTGAGEVIQTHGPWQYKSAGSAVGPGEWTTDVQAPRKVKQITFHNKDANGENADWSDLMPGEVITIVQAGDFSSVGGPTDAWSMINYEVTEFQVFGTATIVDVNCHWTYVVFSTGAVQYNPAESFGFLTNTDTYVIESQPATLNNVVHMAKKTTVAPAFYSYRLIANTTEPALGIRPGQICMSGGSSIQTPNSILVAGNDQYGNGIQSGANTVDCPGSRVSLWRKNLDGSICLCRSYQFNKLISFGNGDKIRFSELTERYKGTNGTPNIPSPGVMESGAQYLLSYELDFKLSAYTLDEEGDPHYGDHRLEDVGHPVAATDAATKGYVDSVTSGGSDLPSYRFASKEMAELEAGEFSCFDSNDNLTTTVGAIRSIMWKGVDRNGNRPIRDKDAISYDGNLNSAFSMLVDNGTKLILRVTMSQVVNGHPKIGYNALLDAYYIYWSGGDTTVKASNINEITNSQIVSFHCPELFF